MTLDTMDHFHSNYGETRQLFDTWARVWGAGGQASLHLHTLEGRARAMLDLQLGHPAAPRPGAPDVRGEGPGQPGPQHQHPQHHHQPAQPPHRRQRRCGPAAERRDAARRAAWWDRQQGARTPAAPAALPPEVLPTPAPLLPESRRRDGTPALPGPRPILLLATKRNASAPTHP